MRRCGEGRTVKGIFLKKCFKWFIDFKNMVLRVIMV